MSVNGLGEEVDRTIYMAVKVVAFSNSEDAVFSKLERELIWANTRILNFPQAIDAFKLVEAEAYDEY